MKLTLFLLLKTATASRPGEMSMMEKAKTLFEQKESMVDGCVNGVDAEIVLQGLGANCVSGSDEVS